MERTKMNCLLTKIDVLPLLHLMLLQLKNIFCKSCGTVYANKLIQARDPACEHPGPEPDPDWGL